MAVLPAEIPTGLVTGQFYFVNADNVDAGTDPDLTVVTGIVKLTCQAKKPLRMPTKKATVIPMVFECEFDSQGRLVPKGRTEIGVEVPASSSNLFNPKDFTWLVQFELRDEATGFTINLEPFSIYVTENVENDLTTLAPVDSSPGTIVVQGPAGPNTVPTDAAIANAVNTPGSTQTALDGRYLQDSEASSVNTPGTIVRRSDGGGFFEAVTPVNGPHVATKSYVDTNAVKLFPTAQTATYNPNGTMASYTVGGVTTTYTYNADDSVATDTRLGVTRNYAYTNGNLVSVTAV